MIKKCIFLCVLFVLRTEGCVDDFFKCFSEFTESFFQSNSEIKHLNATVDNLPENYKQVKDVGIESIEDIASVIQNELLRRIKSEASDVVVTDNPKTKIFVKTFSFDIGSLIPIFGGIDNAESKEEEDKSIQIKSKTTGSHETGEHSTEFGTISIDDKTNTESHKETPARTNEKVTTKHNSLVDNTTYKPNAISKNNESNQTTTFISMEKPDMILQNNNKTAYINKPKQDMNLQLTTISTVRPIDQKSKEKKSVIVKLSNNNQKVTINITDITSLNKTIEITTQKDQENTRVNSNKTNESTKPDRSMATEFSSSEKQFGKDIKENLIEDDESDYESNDGTDYPQIDYIDLYKETTNEENVYVPTDKPEMDIKDEIVQNVEEYSLEIDTGLDIDNSTSICHGNTSDVSNIFPWTATIFIKNNSGNQFQYICDGALLSEKLLITAARCFTIFNSSVMPDDVLVFLGKRSLQVMGEGEMNVRVSKIILHSNFSEDGLNGLVVNDLALMMLEDEVTFTDDIRPACFGDGDGKSATTAWAPSGALTPVFFEKPSDSCLSTEGTVCVTYGNEVPLCPSYGGIYARRHTSHWYLHGIRTGDVADRGLCFSKDVLYTPLQSHLDWIMEYME